MGHSWPDIKSWQETCLDATQGFQIFLTEEASLLTAFITRKECIAGNGLLSDWKGTPSYFQWAMQSLVLRYLEGKDECCVVNIDDENTCTNWGRFWKGSQSGVYYWKSRNLGLELHLGRIVSNHGISLVDSNKDKIRNMVQLLNYDHSWVNFIMDFIDHFAGRQLLRQLSKNWNKLSWMLLCYILYFRR
jgi:hypothetical protein